MGWELSSSNFHLVEMFLCCFWASICVPQLQEQIFSRTGILALTPETVQTEGVRTPLTIEGKGGKEPKLVLPSSLNLGRVRGKGTGRSRDREKREGEGGKPYLSFSRTIWLTC